MSATVFITDTMTGETRTYLDDLATAEDDYHEYLWSEGNYCCDCNRAIFFDVAGGGDGDPDRGCGGERYDIKLVADDGRVILDETLPSPTSASGE